MSESRTVPLSQRRGRRFAFAPVTGVPHFLRPGIEDWIETKANEDWDTTVRLGLELRLNVLHYVDYEAGDAVLSALNEPSRNDDDWLDVVDWFLHEYPETDGTLANLLALAGHELMVAPTGDCLMERIDPTAASMYELVTSPDDKASALMRDAWALTFGRNPRPNDGWGQAIKAIETLLKPIVEPTNTKATLGSMTAALRAAPSKWTCALPDRVFKENGEQTTKLGLEVLTDALATIGYQPGRHGGDNAGEPDSVTVRSVVFLATTVLGWLRDGALTRNS
ncbi:hypothetical protein [Actinomyces procaprae]|uniref:hypothetical protein n=1 Tax=Actinomyces procaprae TaxID=2560010 RepID=UPI0010A20A4E|nr:hypothetical protein [Actinomyces procaprae]